MVRLVKLHLRTIDVYSDNYYRPQHDEGRHRAEAPIGPDNSAARSVAWPAKRARHLVQPRCSPPARHAERQADPHCTDAMGQILLVTLRAGSEMFLIVAIAAAYFRE